MTGKALFSNLTTKSDYIVTINKKESHLEQIQAREGVNGNINKKGLGGLPLNELNFLHGLYDWLVLVVINCQMPDRSMRCIRRDKMTDI